MVNLRKFPIWKDPHFFNHPAQQNATVGISAAHSISATSPTPGLTLANPEFSEM